MSISHVLHKDVPAADLVVGDILIEVDGWHEITEIDDGAERPCVVRKLRYTTIGETHASLPRYFGMNAVFGHVAKVATHDEQATFAQAFAE